MLTYATYATRMLREPLLEPLLTCADVCLLQGADVCFATGGLREPLLTYADVC
jgi:hypothetical protein